MQLPSSKTASYFGYQALLLNFTMALLISSLPPGSSQSNNANLKPWLMGGYSPPADEPKTVLWNPPTLPISDLFYSPCNFPKFSFSHHPLRHPQKKHSPPIPDASKICHGNSKAPFLCDLHRVLNHYSIHSLLRVYHKHLTLFRQDDWSPSFLMLIVRQLIQPTSTNSITSNSSEFGCLFKIPCEPMTAETIQNFVRNTKVFTRVYASALYTQWFPSKGIEQVDCTPKIVALVVLEGVLPNARKVTSVNLHTGNPVFGRYIANIQTETTNMLLQGVPLVEALHEMIDQLGYAVKDFHATKGKFRHYSVPKWAWRLALFSIVLIILSLTLEWAIVRRANNKKMRGYELGKIKAVIKGKTHMIF